MLDPWRIQHRPNPPIVGGAYPQLIHDHIRYNCGPRSDDRFQNSEPALLSDMAQRPSIENQDFVDIHATTTRTSISRSPEVSPARVDHFPQTCRRGDRAPDGT
ncbi:hypothetical protein FMEAI12_4630056 [Parafrankia sp. Ea1.12]|nr:hypothetical protein FMEAI12_4630056 [Parafrankia sp. Ea1.12]